MDFQRREVYFSGDVQGVGFRYTSYRMARNFDVSGWVRNLPDGRVLVTVEGDATELDRFIESVSQAMGSYIHDTKIRYEEYSGDLATFEIRH